MKIGIAGGIGSGKSHVCQLLGTRGIVVYDCDSAAKRLMRSDATLRQRIASLVGPAAYTFDEASDTWQMDKRVVAQFLLASADNAHRLDAIVHPAVFADFEQSGLLWMESALMYESGIHRLVDRVVVVTAPLELRLQRVMRRDGITRQKAQQWVARQMPQDEVRRRADYEIVNDGQHDLEPQIDRLLALLDETP